MTVPAVRILDVFPEHANVNGDGGNVLTLRQRLTWSGIPVEVAEVRPGETWPTEPPDVVHLGGGTVAAQRAMLPALVAESARLGDWADAGVPIVAVAGGLQLMMTGIVFPGDELETPGAALFAGRSRPTARRNSNFLIGRSERFGWVYGFENLGQAVELADGQPPFTRVHTGTGNEHTPGTEGAIRGASIGSQLHGPLLPKNPAVADGVIADALARRGIEGYALTDRHRQVDGYAEQGKRIIRERLKVALPA